MSFFQRRIKDLWDRLTATRAANLDNLDATVSSRLAAASYVAPDNAGIGTASTQATNAASRVGAQPAADATADATVWDVVGRKADAAPSTGTAANTTLSQTAYLKALWNLLRSVTWSNVSNLDAAVSTRLAAASYTAPDNATVSSINTKVGTNADGSGTTTLFAWMARLYAAIGSPLQAGSYTAPDNSSISTILGRTDVNTSTRATPADVGSGPTRPSAADNATAAGSANIYDVLGRKDDSATTTVGTATTMMRYIKGIVGALVVPSADATTDATVRDVLGRKTDTANATVGATSSVMRYVKALLGGDASTMAANSIGKRVADLDGRLTSGRATNLDNLNASVSTRRPLLSTVVAGKTSKTLGAAGTYTEVVTINGAGRIRMVWWDGGNTHVRITVDGGTPYYVRSGTGGEWFLRALWNTTAAGSADRDVGTSGDQCDIEFRSSFKIEGGNPGGFGTVTYAWFGQLE